ncbi:hypothetical protein OZX69_03520 [Lactobacillus sp. ESL0731]|uniref:hypothetical protein n=1 Tax=unclassified Lactobacillus TaxID=2620435 RepID=UPI0023F68FAA|nr:MULTISPECIES: hypothetical protein [unclassified Lactobacillus]WEV51779.1 hypothetical protein OZX63_03520 [Lactobacillus sp. ESL0700]WEV62908.1 hypothetical protein OZX69_03520 [Lactobacillus sp. ESL0731]
MKKLNTAKVVTALSACLIMGSTILPASTTFAAEMDNQQSVVSSSNTVKQDVTKTISNREMFKSLEAQGVDVKGILGEKGYQEALAQDLMRHGGTYIKTHKHGFTIYLNSAIVKILVWGGATAASSVVGSLLSSVGLEGLGATAITQIVKSVIKGSASKASKRGVYVSFSNRGSYVSWGYQ